ncbi:flagellin [Brevundimonas staleyi]|uniref:Flagellin n=1 Tax=Brevundimonas staleyi TaxID=74326 RepID=A0ABW0FYG8_9CAUL
MSRVSTNGNYQSALLNLMQAQQTQNEAGERVQTRKVATDMAGFGRGAETLTALKGADARVQGFLDTGEAVSARLGAQDLAINQMVDGLAGAREAIGSMLASDSMGTLMLELEGQFQSVASGLNYRHQGGYLFAGADTTNAPVKVSTLNELVAAPNVAATLGNDQIKQVSRVAENTSIETGYLADGFKFTDADGVTQTHIFQIFRDIKAYNDDPATGPLSGKPTEAQKTFLIAQMKRLESASTATIDAAARNGSLAKRMEDITKSHEAQQLSLQELVAARTDVDPLKAVTELQLSQVAVQASAQVVAQLKDVSLLNYLR